MEPISFFLSLAIYIVALSILTYAHRRKYNALADAHQTLQDDLADLKKKSQMEQDLSLATTEQLMSQLQDRVPGFILITPAATNAQSQQGMNVHIKGLPPQVAISCMQFACQVVATNAPKFGGWEED